VEHGLSTSSKHPRLSGWTRKTHARKACRLPSIGECGDHSHSEGSKWENNWYAGSSSTLNTNTLLLLAAAAHSIPPSSIARVKLLIASELFSQQL